MEFPHKTVGVLIHDFGGLTPGSLHCLDLVFMVLYTLIYSAVKCETNNNECCSDKY